MAEQVTDDVTTGQKVAGASCNAALCFVLCKSSFWSLMIEQMWFGGCLQLTLLYWNEPGCWCILCLYLLLDIVCVWSGINIVYNVLIPIIYTYQFQYKHYQRIYKQVFAHVYYIYMWIMDVKVNAMQIAAARALFQADKWVHGTKVWIHIAGSTSNSSGLSGRYMACAAENTLLWVKQQYVKGHHLKARCQIHAEEGCRYCRHHEWEGCNCNQ